MHGHIYCPVYNCPYGTATDIKGLDLLELPALPGVCPGLMPQALQDSLEVTVGEPLSEERQVTSPFCLTLSERSSCAKPFNLLFVHFTLLPSKPDIDSCSVVAHLPSVYCSLC